MKDQLLLYAKTNYPPGTKIISAYTFREYKVHDRYQAHPIKDDFDITAFNKTGGRFYLRCDGKWAEILK